ncbi:MAG: flagellar basal body rod protein FlgB [Firmicutes bacterium]|nr:flagellar basal body rod protein FlgB [Bacillota bacterium]
MDFPGSNDITYNLLKKSLDATSLRHNAITNNISNINTKNYKANRVKFEEELKKALNKDEIKLNATNKRHFGISSKLDNIKPRTVKDKKTAMSSDGNNVDIDLEMTNLAANQIKYNALIQQTNKKLRNFSYIINGGR